MVDADGRQFACFPVAILVFLVNEEEELLMLSHPERRDQWEIVKGAVDAGETIQEAAFRETHEEVGPDVRVRSLGTVHTATVWHDECVGPAISVFYLMSYQGGEIKPGDDMSGSQFRWSNLEDMRNESIKMAVPREKWIVRRAIELYRLWKDSEMGSIAGKDKCDGV
jgi:ADP-ribose pyrophosphatase YjhB (NUDIX family)